MSSCKYLLCLFSQDAGLPQEASSEAKVEAEKLKNEGNNLMKAEQFTEALQLYTR
jgi:hypothetical protein